jgi:alanine-synthesizing transaminase
VARAAGRTILDLTESNPTRAGIAYPGDLLAPLSEPRGLQYEPHPFGLRAAREAAAREYARHGAAVDPDAVLMTASTSEAYSFAFKLLCDPGDEVLVPQPSYPLFDFLAGLDSAVVRPYPLLLADGEWHVDLEALAAAAGPRARAIVVVHPNNPTGSFLKDHEQAALLALAEARDLAIVSDEVFLDYAEAPDARRAGSLAAADRALVLAMGGLSKSCGLPQLKLGWMAVAGEGRRRAEALARLEIVADTYLSVATPVQLAAPELLRRGARVRESIAERVRTNRAHLRARLRGTAASVLPAEGGWYALVQMPAVRSAEETVLLLIAEQGVHVQPGFFFGLPGDALLVLSLLTPPDVFDRGLIALTAIL